MKCALTGYENVSQVYSSLQWRHNGRDGASNHPRLGCLLNCLFRHRSKKTLKLRVTGLCEGNSPVAGEFPAQMASNAENVSIWWYHHVHMFLCHYMYICEFGCVFIHRSFYLYVSVYFEHNIYLIHMLLWCYILLYIFVESRFHRILLEYMLQRLILKIQIKENTKAPRHWPLCGEFTGTGEFPAQMASYAEKVSIWWRHRALSWSRRCQGKWCSAHDESRK